VLFIFLLKYSGVLVTKLSERFVTSRFRAAESLLKEGRLPANWSERIHARVFHGIPARLGLRVRDQLENDAKRMMLGMLDGLIKYFGNSPFFDNPDTRTMFLERLEAVRESWRQKSWEEIMAQYTPAGSLDPQR
jgi:hypothetical protein